MSSQLLTEAYLSAAHDAGCPFDQLRNFERAGIVLQPRQLLASAAARLCDRPDGPTAIGYGGARGGGKSFWLLAQMGADDCQRVPGLKCLLLRKVGKANLEHFEDLRRRLFLGLPHEFSAHRGILTFANGSRIVAGHFQAEKDIDAYLGLEYDVIGIEEATTLTHRKYQDISTCCRSSKTYLPTIAIGAPLSPSGERPRVRGASDHSPLTIHHSPSSPSAVRLPSSDLGTTDHSPSSPSALRPLPSDLCPPSSGSPSASAFDVRCSTFDVQSSKFGPQPSPVHWRPRIYSTTNPGGIGHAWYRKLFIEPHVSRQRTLATSTFDVQCSTFDVHPTHFIPALVSDNRWNNPEYVRVLQSLTGWQRRAWLDGDWDIAAGQFFSTFRREAHVIPHFDDRRAVEWFAALDYGFTHYTVVLLGCRDSDGNYYVVDEHAERLWLPQRHAAAIKAMLARRLVPKFFGRPNAPRLTFRDFASPPSRELDLSDLHRFVAGADVFSRQSDGTTVAEQYARQGINLRLANTDRINGWAEILQRLGDLDGGVRPTLFIHQRCARLIQTLPVLQHDPNRPEDVLKVDADDDGHGGDDAADCLRYLVATKPREILVTKLRGL